MPSVFDKPKAASPLNANSILDRLHKSSDIRKVKVMNKITRNIYYILRSTFYSNPQKYLLIRDKSLYLQRLLAARAAKLNLKDMPKYLVHYAPMSDDLLTKLKITKKQYKHPFKLQLDGDFVIAPSIYGLKYLNVFDFINNASQLLKEVLYVFVSFPDKVHVGWNKKGVFLFAVLDKELKKLIALTYSEAIKNLLKYKILTPIEYKTVLDILSTKKRRQIRKLVLNLSKSSSYLLLRLGLSMLFLNNHKRLLFHKYIIIDNMKKYLPFIFNKKYKYHTLIVQRGTYWYAKLDFNIPIYKQPLILFNEELRNGQLKYILPDGSLTIYKREYLKSIVLNEDKVDNSTIKLIFLKYFKYVPNTNIDKLLTSEEDLETRADLTLTDNRKLKEPVALKKINSEDKTNKLDE